MPTTTTQPDVIDRAFALDLKALAAAEAVAAAIAAGESPSNVREICRAADWGEDRLKKEVVRMREVISLKKAIAPGDQAQFEVPKVHAQIDAQHLWIGKQKKEYNARVGPLVGKLQVLSAASSAATRARLFLRDALLPCHVRDEIKAIAKQMLPINANRARLEDEIHKLKLQIPEDVVLMANMTAAGARDEYRKEIARRNDERASIRRNREAQLEQIKQVMQGLHDREDQLRSTYVPAEASSPAGAE